MLDLEVRIRCSMPTSDLAMLDADSDAGGVSSSLCGDARCRPRLCETDRLQRVVPDLEELGHLLALDVLHGSDGIACVGARQARRLHCHVHPIVAVS